MTAKSIYDLWLEVNDAELTVNAQAVPWDQWKQRVQWKRSEGAIAADRQLYMGATTLDGFELRAPTDFRRVDSFCDDPYRIVWASREQRIILTYCEGDLSYEEYADDAAFRAGFLSAAKFYQDH